MDFRKLIILLLLFIPFTNVYALEAITVDCNKEKKIYVCKIEGNFDYEISAIDFHYSLPDYAKLEDFKIDPLWLGSADNNWLSVYASNDFYESFPIMELSISSNKKINNEDIKITDILVYDKKFQEHKVKLDVKQTKKRQPSIIIDIICVIIILTIIIVLSRKKIIKILKRGDAK